MPLPGPIYLQRSSLHHRLNSGLALTRAYTGYNVRNLLALGNPSDTLAFPIHRDADYMARNRDKGALFRELDVLVRTGLATRFVRLWRAAAATTIDDDRRPGGIGRVVLEMCQVEPISVEPAPAGKAGESRDGTPRPPRQTNPMFVEILAQPRRTACKKSVSLRSPRTHLPHVPRSRSVRTCPPCGACNIKRRSRVAACAWGACGCTQKHIMSATCVYRGTGMQ